MFPTTAMLEDRDYARRRNPVVEEPSILWVLVVVNVAALVLRLLFSAGNNQPAGAISVAALQEGGWWTVLTHAFVHADAVHLFFNMALLVVAGRRVLTDTGPRHFLYIYLVSGWVAAAVSLLLHPDASLFGASGCAAGVMGAYAALHPERSVTAWMGAWAPRLRAGKLFLGFLAASVGLEIFATLTEEWRLPLIHGTGHAAHAAGLLTGWLYAGHLAPALANLYHREEFFPQGRRLRRDTESPPIPARAGRQREAFEVPLPAPVPMTNDEFLRQAVDPVLDKLYANGMGSLTPAERRILDEAANRFSEGRPLPRQ